MSRDIGILYMGVSIAFLMLLFFRVIKVSDRGHHWTDTLYEKIHPVFLAGIAIFSGFGAASYAFGLTPTTRLETASIYGGAVAFGGIIPAMAVSLLIAYFLRERKKPAKKQAA